MRKADLDLIIEEFAVTLDRTNQILKIVDYDMEKGRDNLFISLQKMRSTLEHLEEAARMINEDPSLLLRGSKYQDIPDEDLDR